MSTAVTCYVRRLSETVPDIHLPDGERVVLGRGPLTRIRDRSVSREQIALVANYVDYSVRLEVTGGNPSGLGGIPLHSGEVRKVQHKEEIRLLVDSHPFVILFDPPPPTSNNDKQKRINSEPKMVAKKQRLNIPPPDFKTTSTNESRTWISINDSDAHLMISKDESINPKLAVFDMDNTIICTKSGNVFPKTPQDWQLLYPQVPGKLKSLIQDGYRVVIYTNQGGVARGKVSMTDIRGKLESIFLQRIKIPVTVLMCTAKGGMFRKPRRGLWDIFVEEYNGGMMDESSSFFVGDAAGRNKGWKSGKKKDFSLSDRLFALNVGLRFFTPEEHFLSEAPTKAYTMPSFDPTKLGEEKRLSLLDPADAELETKDQEVVMLVGMMGSGKSFFARRHFPNYVLASNDVSGGREKTLRVLENALTSGKSVVIDNTHPEVSTRSKYIDKAALRGVRVRCFLMNMSASHAKHNNLFRELVGEDHVQINEILFNQYAAKFEAPALGEGFHSIVKVNFVPEFRSEAEEKLYRSYLLEK